METFIFDGKGKNLQKALEVQSRGGRVLCPKCQSELMIICTIASKKKHKNNLIIFCRLTKNMCVVTCY